MNCIRLHPVLSAPRFWGFESRVASATKSGWLLKDCVAVHQLLETSFKDSDAASSKLILFVI